MLILVIYINDNIANEIVEWNILRMAPYYWIVAFVIKIISKIPDNKFLYHKNKK